MHAPPRPRSSSTPRRLRQAPLRFLSRAVAPALLIALALVPGVAGARSAPPRADARGVQADARASGASSRTRARVAKVSALRAAKGPKDGHAGKPGGAVTASGTATAAAGLTYTQHTYHEKDRDVYMVEPDQRKVCVYGDGTQSADIAVPIKVGWFGNENGGDAVDANGYPVQGNSLYGKQGLLRVILWDVDDHADASPPEWDILYFGQPLGNGAYDDFVGQLTGENDDYSSNFFQIDMSRIKPKSAVNPTGINYLNVDIDTGNNGTGSTDWCVAVEAVYLEPVKSPLPTVLVHGFTRRGEAMTTMLDYYITEYPALHGLVLAPQGSDEELDRFGGMAVRARDVEGDVQKLLNKTGHSRVNLVGHSFGGLVARYYAYRHPDQVANVLMLGTPNGGDKLADYGCGILDWTGNDALLHMYIESKAGPCKFGYALSELRRGYMQDWNRNHPDPSQIGYYTYAGYNNDAGFEVRGNLFAALLWPAANDTLVTVDSVNALTPPNGHHFFDGSYFVVHEDLHEDFDPINDTLCRLYPEGCQGLPPSGFRRTAMRAQTGARAAASVASEGREVSAVNDLQVVPGAAADVPVAFEGASGATIDVVSDQVDSLTASFGATPFVRGELLPNLPALAVALDTPADGVVHITNNGTAAASVRLSVALDTSRKLTVTASPSLVRPGSSVTLTASLTQPVAGDAPHLTVRGADGAAVAELDPTANGSGQWTVNWMPSAAGQYAVEAVVAGPKSRHALGEFAVASGAATVAAGLTEQTLDENGNGLTDVLVVRPTVTVQTAGSYSVGGQLLDASGSVVAATGSVVDLAAGAQPVDLRFDGRAIHDAGSPGPYRLSVSLSKADDDSSPEDANANVGSTAAHNPATFEHDRLTIDDRNLSDQGRDSNGDGLFDDLLVTANVTVEQPGDYNIYGKLVAPDGTEVASRGAIATFAAGANTLNLAFFGSDIGRAGKNGPYTLASLTLTSIADPRIATAIGGEYKTAAYTLSQFAGPDVTGALSVGGPPVSLSLPSGTQYGRVTFSGTSGQRVSVDLTSSTISSGYVEIRTDDGRVAGEASLDSSGGFIEPARLPKTGTYTIVVDPDAAGSVTLQAFNVADDVTAPITAGGSPVTVTTTTPGQNAWLTFTGSLNQKVTIRLTSSAISSGGIGLYDPAGNLVASAPITAGGAFIDSTSLTAAGQYTILVDPARAQKGAATVTLSNVAGDVTGTIRTDRATTIATTASGQNAKLTFSGTLNQRVSISMTSTAITSGTMSLRKPDGTTFQSAQIAGGGSYIDAVNLPVAGTWTIYLDPAGTQTGSMSVTLNGVSDVTGAITTTKAVTSSTTKPGQNVKLTFSGTLNQRVSVKVASNAFTAGTIELRKPDGSAFQTAQLGSTGNFVDAVNLPVAGTWSIYIDPTGSVTGSVTSNLYAVADTTGTIVPGGAGVPVTIATPGQNGRLTFTAAAYDRVSVTLASSTIAGGTVSLRRADDSTIASASFGTSGGSIATQVLTAAGSYSVYVDPSGANTGAVTVTVGKGPSDVTGTITAGGAPLTVTTTAPDQNARITFTGAVNQRISLKLSNVTIAGSSCCSAYVSIIKPNGTTNLVSPTFFGTLGGFIDLQQLDTAGTYTILIDPQGTATGSATLTLYNVPADETAAITAGTASTINVGTPGQNAVRTFTGTAGGRISLKVSNVAIGSSACCSIKVSIERVGGANLVNPTYVGTQGGFIDVQQTAAADYRIVVDPQGSDTGSATLTLYNVPADDTAPIAPGGPAQTITLGTPGQNAVRTFTATDGQRISLKLTNVTIGTSACCSTKVSIERVGGGPNLVNPTSVGTLGGFIDVTTATAGDYRIVLDPQGGDTGSATLALYDVPADDSGSITPGGAAQTITLGTPGQNAVRTFTATDGQRISLNVTNVTIGTSACCSTKVSIERVGGGANLVDPTSIGTFGGFIDVRTATAGTYRIVLDPQGGDTGSATLALYDVPADVAGTTSVGGPAVTVTTSTPGQNGTLTFQGTAGQALRLTLSNVTMGSSACCSARVSVTGPTSTPLAPSYVGTFGTSYNFSLTEGGQHTIRIDPQDAATGNMTVTLTTQSAFRVLTWHHR